MAQFIRGGLPPQTLVRRGASELRDIDPAITETIKGFRANPNQFCEWYRELTSKKRNNADRHIMQMSRELAARGNYLAFDIVSELLSQSVPLTKKLISAVASDVLASRFAVDSLTREANAWLRQLNCESHEGKLFTPRRNG